MKIVVGSKNPVKVEAVREAFSRYWVECLVEGVEVGSGVGEQPRSEEETIQGAKNRAKNSIGEAEYGVGLEGGVCQIEGKMFECAWVCIVDKSGNLGIAGGLYFELPDKVAEKIKAGGELGPIMEQIMQFDVKRTKGAIGVFTRGELDRKSAYVQIVLSAMIKFVSPEWFE